MFKFIVKACSSFATMVSTAFNAVIEFFFGKKETAPVADEPVDLKWENEEAPAPFVPEEVKEKMAAQTKELETAVYNAIEGKNFSAYLVDAFQLVRVLTDEEMNAVKAVIDDIDNLNDSYIIYKAFVNAVGKENIHTGTGGMCAQDQIRKGRK